MIALKNLMEEIEISKLFLNVEKKILMLLLAKFIF